MADNIGVTPGAGATVATDDIGGVHYQFNKLVDGTLNSTTPIPGDGSGLSVQGQVAADAAVAGRPVVTGGRASDAVPTAMSADGDSVHAWFDRRGAQKAALVDDAGDSVMDGANNAVRVNVVSGAGGGVSHTDDAAFTPGTSPVVPAAGIYRSTRDLVDDNDAGALAMTQRRALFVAIETPNGDSAMDDTEDALKVSVVSGEGGTALTDPLVDSSGTPVLIKYVSVNATLDGDNPIISAVASRKIVVLGYVLTATAAGTITIQDTAGTPNVIARIRSGADGGGASYAGGIDAPAFETISGNGLEINCSAGLDCLGHISYIEKA
jgi:hypothetical protein